MANSQGGSVILAILPSAIVNCFSVLRSAQRSSGLLALILKSRPSKGVQPDATLVIREERNQGLHDDGAKTREHIVATTIQRRKRGHLMQRGGQAAVPEDSKEIEPDQGVKWLFAEQGRSLYRSAYGQREDKVFSRRAYIDGVAYLLLGLPDDLDVHEHNVIREALPPSVKLDQGARDQTQQEPLGAAPKPPDLSFMLRCVAGLVRLAGAALRYGTSLLGLFNMVLVILHMLLSFIIEVISLFTQYERRHNLSQRVLNLSETIKQRDGA